MKASTVQKKRRSGLCITPYCRNYRRRKGATCNTCSSRLYGCPLRRLFRNLKAHARYRGKHFDLTFAEFMTVAVASGYDRNHGRERGRLHVDRVDARLGYVAGNIRILTSSENSKKGWAERHGYAERWA